MDLSNFGLFGAGSMKMAASAEFLKVYGIRFSNKKASNFQKSCYPAKQPNLFVPKPKFSTLPKQYNFILVSLLIYLKSGYFIFDNAMHI